MADLQADYDALQSMANIFEQAAQQFDQMQNSIQNMAGVLEGGALKGVAGDRLVRLLQSNLARKVAFGAEKFRELKQDVLDAMGDLSDADQQGASQF